MNKDTLMHKAIYDKNIIENCAINVPGAPYVICKYFYTVYKMCQDL